VRPRLFTTICMRARLSVSFLPVKCNLRDLPLPGFGDFFQQQRCCAAFAFGENEPGRLVYDRRCT
jgi:hypothetical protein